MAAVSALKPITRKATLASSVVDQLRDQIISGTLGIGAELPSERELGERLQVSRGAVREALARLEQCGLIRTRQGGATRVRDYRTSAGLDLLPTLFLDSEGMPNAAIFRSALEMRAAIAPDVARLCARRSGERVGPVLQGIVRQMEGERDPKTLRRLNVRYWQELLLGSENVAYQLAYNSLRLAFDRLEDALASAMTVELRDVDGFRALAAAIARKDPEAAASMAEEHIARSLEDALAIFART